MSPYAAAQRAPTTQAARMLLPGPTHRPHGAHARTIKLRRSTHHTRNVSAAGNNSSSSNNNINSSSIEPVAAEAGDVAGPLVVLRRAATTKAVPAGEVVEAMRQVEAAHRQRGGLVQGFPAALNGTWRLVFSSPSAISAWQYIPVIEDAVIDVDAGTLDIVSDVLGVLDARFSGRCSVEGGADLRFSFYRTEFLWFKRFKTGGEISGKDKVYSFFLLSDDLAVANSSSGPTTLMLRVK